MLCRTAGIAKGVLLAMTLALLVQCSASSDESSARQKTKVVLIGIDGATWAVVKPLLAAGRLPTFERLIDAGSAGILHSEEPLLSPPIWTTIATGRSREAHGVDGFFYLVDEGKEMLIDSSQRQVSALWNWMGPLRRTVGFAGWWASWPAEEVNGWMISDRFARSQWSAWPGGVQSSGVTHPARLADELLDMESPQAAVWLSELKTLADFTSEEWTHIEQMERPIPYDSLSDLKFGYLSQRTYEEAFLKLLDQDQPDLSAVFLIANDPISHSFWHYYEPEVFEQVDRAEAERLGTVLPRFWEHLDRFLARLLEEIDLEHTAVLIVSDHGFEASGELKPSGEHIAEGVLIASGAGVRVGASLDASILDIAPTVLRLLEGPLPKDMEGGPVEGLITPEFLRAHPLRQVDSFETLFKGVKRPELLGPGDEDMRRQLESLGYLDSGN